MKPMSARATAPLKAGQAGRLLIERCWARLKERRAVATRYDKTASSYAATIAIATSLDWIKSLLR